MGPSPVTLLPYAASDRFPAAWQGWQTMSTFFLKFYPMLTLSNRPTRALESTGSQQGSDEATMPLSA